MATGPFRSLRLLPLVLAAGIVLTACGSSSTGTPVPAVPAASSVASPTDSDSIPTDDGSSGSGNTTGSSGTSDANPTTDQASAPAGAVSVRIANTYLIPKGQQPPAIDVWSGLPGSGGKKLATVPFGTVSSYFTPPVTDPSSQSFTLNLYIAGGTSDDAGLGSQSETGGPGLKLTILVAAPDPTEPPDLGPPAPSIKVYADSVGSEPGNSGFTTAALPTPAAGNSVLLLDALSLRGRAGMTQTSSGLTPSSSDGKCLPYYETNTAGSGFSSTLHDMASATVDTFGGTSDLPYQVSSGSQVRINQPKNDQLIPAACADKPVFGPFDPKVAAGQGAYGFLYGTDLAHAKILLVPVG